MKDENILDDGEIYKDWEEELVEHHLPELELEQQTKDNVNWTPLKHGGSNFKGYKLVVRDNDTIKFTGTPGAYLFAILFIAIGLMGVMVLVGIVFLIAGLALLDSYTISSIFDKRVGLYWKSRLSIYDRFFTDKQAFSIKLSDVKAVQLLKEHIKGSENSYNSYETNLILLNNERINVVDHGHLESALKDAQHLANYLEVPLLNGLNT